MTASDGKLGFEIQTFYSRTFCCYNVSMISNRLLQSLALLGCVLAALCPALTAQAVHPGLLVSTQWLAKHLNDPKVVVLQVGEDRGAYDRGHIPGARFLSDPQYVIGHEGLMFELPPVEQLKKAFEDVGVSDDSKVVIYTTEFYPTAGRAFFTLDYLGHKHTALLNGSLAQWELERRPLSRDTPHIAKGTITPRVNEAARALLAEAKAAAQPNSNTVLVDARPAKRYASGHLPGAENIFWEETVESAKKPVFLPPDQLKKLFASRRVEPGGKLMTYCEVGLQAAHMYFVARYLGYDVSLYDGSFYQWDKLEHLPVVTGSNSR